MRRGEVFLSDCDVTESAWERMRGLLPRSRLGVNEALWLSPCTSVHTFFMRFEMDAAFLDRQGRVIAIYDSMRPWRHTWIHPFAAGVLELAGGTLRRAGVEKGEVLELCLTS